MRVKLEIPHYNLCPSSSHDLCGPLPVLALVEFVSQTDPVPLAHNTEAVVFFLMLHLPGPSLRPDRLIH